MALEVPRAADMFSDADGSAEIADRMELYKGALADSLARPQPVPQPGMPAQESSVAVLEKALGDADVAKALAPELIDSVRTALASGDVNKDWTTSNPLASGLVAFDLEAPAKILVPRATPLRNRIARRKGIGLAHRFKRITGITGSQTGGVADMWPGVTESTTTTFGSVPYLRGAKISYAGDDVAVNYKQFGVSDQVSWAAQFAGQGFDDMRQLSQTALLLSSMQLEEKLLLGARGTDAGYAGAVQPTISLAARAAGSGEVALSGVSTNIYVKVVGNYVWGKSALSAVATVAPSTQVVDVTVTNADSNGALSYDVFVGTGSSEPADSAKYRMVVANTASKIVLGGALPVAGTAANTITGDTSSYATGYDGILTYACGPNSGYVKHINNTFAGYDGTNVGNCFGEAFVDLYDDVKADPDEIFANGSDRKQLSDQLKTQGSSGFRISLTNGESHGASVGSIVNAIYNPVTGKAVDLTVHPWLPQGVMPIVSWTLPIPDSNVSDTFAVYNVQDYMGINWPVNQFAYEVSSYWYGTMVNYAPAWNGAIMGIKRA